MLVCTVDTPPENFLITAVYGIAIGCEATPVNKYESGVRPLDRNGTTDYRNRLRYARTSAIDAMREDALGMGANAVVGVRFDSRLLSESGTWMELCAYGTAVMITTV